LLEVVTPTGQLAATVTSGLTRPASSGKSARGVAGSSDINKTVFDNNQATHVIW
jgi:hypothetical protein